MRLEETISPYDLYCDGFGNPGASGNGYLIGINLGVGKSNIELSHEGSNMLDSTNAFDRAEVDQAYIGQINMITVSSFCGPAGAVWGYHIARPKALLSKHQYFSEGYIEIQQGSVPVFSASPLVEATKSLFGTVDNKKFPLRPGAHVPCAQKNILSVGQKHLYCSFALGMAEESETQANLLMEDVGFIPEQIIANQDIAGFKHSLLKNLATSVLVIGENQRIKFKEIFVEIRDIQVNSNEVGCALVAVPYFTLAKRAIPSYNLDLMKALNLEDWQESVKTVV